MNNFSWRQFGKSFAKIFILATLLASLLYSYTLLPGRIIVSRNIEDSDFYIDGIETDFQKSLWLKPGEHSIEIIKDGYLAVTSNVKIKPLFKYEINLDLLKITDLSDGQSDNISYLKVAATEKDYIYIDEDQKAVMQFTNNKNNLLLELPFLQDEIIFKYKWSNDQNFLFIKTVSGENYVNRLVDIKNKSIGTLGADILDISYYQNTQYYLKKDGADNVKIFSTNNEVAEINKSFYNLETTKNNIIAFNTIIDGDSRTIAYCNNEGDDCKTINSEGDIYQITSNNERIMVITFKDKYSLYELSNGKLNLVDGDILPLSSWDNDFYYLRNGGNCQIIRSTKDKTEVIYSNSSFCEINDFSISGKSLYFLEGVVPYKLELK